MNIIKRIKIGWQKVLKIVRDPAWTFVSCVIALIGIVGLSSIIAFFTGKLHSISLWLLTPIYVYRISIVLNFVFLFLIILFLFIHLTNDWKLRRIKAVTIPKNYYSYWEVLWKRVNGLSGIWIEGPFCPLHKFILEIEFVRSENRFFFTCIGSPEKGSHTFQGPLLDHLILPQDHNEISTYDDAIRFDVRERIDATLRNEGKL